MFNTTCRADKWYMTNRVLVHLHEQINSTENKQRYIRIQTVQIPRDKDPKSAQTQRKCSNWGLRKAGKLLSIRARKDRQVYQQPTRRKHHFVIRQNSIHIKIQKVLQMKTKAVFGAFAIHHALLDLKDLDEIFLVSAPTQNTSFNFRV